MKEIINEEIIDLQWLALPVAQFSVV